ncbi:hypothetical protein pdam_00010130 [Pocillopora damicornis]|uniref:Neurotransmitter-gated ion-channel ligand-binding domain-containing protein n=1 Tax=Pocillopora damicornis TaxID=46731 RepID=A0A3M6V3L4_POCDA|nr:hypothetical protein pdam_00010130 [Pocillopora damicornis]
MRTTFELKLPVKYYDQDIIIFGNLYQALHDQEKIALPVTVAKPDTTTTPKSMPSSSSNFNVSQLIRDLLDGYDKRLRPNFGGPPVNVSATVFIEFIGDIDEINMEFTTIMYFRQYWKDERLKYNHKGYKKRLAFNPEMLKFIWVPDTHFPGIKDGLKHDITDTNEVVRLWPDGTYSLLTIQFDLTRRLGFHMIQIYLPCYLIVVLAWVSFWVDREQTAARIAMGITTVLTMATLIGSARTSLPKVSYVKSLEWFLMMCFLFVFSAILEYAFVSYLVFKQREEERNRVAMRKKHDEDKASEAAEVLVDNDKTPPSPGSRPSSGQEAVWIPGKSQVETVTRPGKCRGSKKPPSEDHYVRILNTVEFFSRLLFPVVFIFLNIAYWLYYGGILTKKGFSGPK